MVYKRGGVYWIDFSIKGHRVRESTRLTNKAAALVAEAKKRAEIVNGQKDCPYFHPFIEEFLAWSKATQKPSTHRRYAVSSRPLRFFKMKVNELTQADIERFKVGRLKQCSPAGVNRDLAALRFLLSFAIRQRYIRESPFRGIKMLPEGPGNMRIVSPEEEELYLQHANPLLKDVAGLILETGMRPGEVFALKPGHVGEDFVRVAEGKTRYARRTIPLTPQAGEILRRRMAPANGYLFPHRTRQAPMVCVRSHKRLVKQLKLDFRLYDFRHTFGSRAAMAGVDLPTLKELMGHSSITTTMRYVHPTPEHKREAVKKLEAFHGTLMAQTKKEPS